MNFQLLNSVNNKITFSTLIVQSTINVLNVIVCVFRSISKLHRFPVNMVF